MSVNTAHANGGVLIHSGEYILLHSKNFSIEFFGQKSPIFYGAKHGHIYLTSHRMIFRSKRQTELLLSFSAPFIAMSNVEFEEPDNCIIGKVRAQPNANYTGKVKFQLYFESGGAAEYAQALNCATSIALSKLDHRCAITILPPYTPPRAWYEAPEATYHLRSRYCNWLPKHDIFTNPRPNSVFMTDNPAPFPGIVQHYQNSPCESIRIPFESGRCPTPIHNFGGFGPPPIYGIFTSLHPNGVFPHQATYPTINQTCDCECDELSEADINCECDELSEDDINDFQEES